MRGTIVLLATLGLLLVVPSAAADSPDPDGPGVDCVYVSPNGIGYNTAQCGAVVNALKSWINDRVPPA